MTAARATDEVTDAIAYIEMHRQEKERESGVAAACSESLRKLNELLEQEKAASDPQCSEAEKLANIEAVAQEIQRIQRIAGNKNQGGAARSQRPGGQQHHAPGRNGPRKQARNKGRRPMGRRGGER